MSREEQIQFQNIAKEALKANRSKEEIMKSMQGAGIIDKDGNVNEPYTKVLIRK